MFTKQHYIRIARILNDQLVSIRTNPVHTFNELQAFDRMYLKFEKLFIEDNPRFDYKKFKEATYK